MTEGAKNIIRKDLKKYEQLVKYSDEENGKEYQKIVNCMEEILN